MPWSKFVLIIAAILLGLLIYFFGFNHRAENKLTTELERIQADIAARGDGSDFQFSKPSIKGHKANVDEIRYIDGNGVSIEVKGLVGVADTKFLREAHIETLNIINANKTHITLENISTEGLRLADNYIGKYDRYRFDEFSAQNISISGKYENSDVVFLKLAGVLAENFDEHKLESLRLQGLDIGNQEIMAFQTDEIELRDIKYYQLVEIINEIKEGNIPIRALENISIGSIDLDALRVLLDNETIIDEENGEGAIKMDESKILEFFVKNAPPELQDFIGTTDGDELAERLEEFQEKPSEDQAIDALQLMLDFMKANKGEPAQ